MKKNITINLFGSLYAIDEDACKLLEEYLENMKRYFSKREGGDEIADDIEHRVAEIFAELKEQGVEAVSIEQVEEIIHRIGNPQEMDNDSEAETSGNSAHTGGNGEMPPPPPFHDGPQEPKRSWFEGRKLFRDPEDQMLGGVMAGLCKYFGGNDPLPWRIITIILAFVSLSTIGILYLLAWAFIPQASTAEERLLMQGKPINPQTLNEELMRGANKAGEYIRSGGLQSKAHGFFGTLLRIIVFCVKIIGLFAFGIATLVLLAFTAILAFGCLGGASALIAGGIMDSDFIEMLNANPAITWELWGIAVTTFVCLCILLYALVRSFIKRPTDKNLNTGTRITLTLICILSAATAITLTTLAAIQIEHAEDVLQKELDSEGGYYLRWWERQKVNSKNWTVLTYRNCNDSGTLYESDRSFLSKENYTEYMRFEKGGKPEAMQVQIDRAQHFEAGHYRIEAIGWAKSSGVYVYAIQDGKAVAVAELPADDAQGYGNMQGMTREQIQQTALFPDSIDAGDWSEHVQKRIKGWSYVQSATFYHPGGTLNYGITNMPSAVGISGSQPTAWKFALRNIVIEPVKTAPTPKTIH